MPLSTNLSVSPYFDDYNSDNDYYRILFKPATAVQVREMNQLQAMLQHQIEEFGDHILKAGTVLSGCQFSYQTSMPYVKILDTAAAGAAVDVASYTGLFAYGETNNSVAKVVHTIAGFEGDSAGNLNTLYLNYVDGGTTNDSGTFAESEVLKLYSGDKRLYDIAITAGSSGFSNNDNVVILSAIEVANNTSGSNEFANTFINGETLVDNISNPTIRVKIYQDPVIDDELNVVRLQIRPLFADMAPTPDSSKWSNIQPGITTLISLTTGNECVVTSQIGENATGSIVTTRTGTISSAEITTGGTGYSTLPYVGVYSTTATATQVEELDLTAQDYLTRVQVADSARQANPIGYGFGINVGAGKIYQKGHFLNVNSQFAMVSKYSNTPSDLSVGFNTAESIVNVFSDSTLFDNASGFLNEGAPGANRLKLEPVLVTRTSLEEETDSQYFPLVKFSEGRPFAQNQLTQYNKLGDMIAARTYEESGNYTLDEFRLTMKSTQSIANSDTNFTYVIDPGHAYINGYKVKTVANYAKQVEKATTTTTQLQVGQDLVYGHYVEVNSVYGIHQFKNAETVYLKPQVTTSGYGGALLDVNVGVDIGEAKIRNIIFVSGVQGTTTAKYRIYLFDIVMYNGKNFKEDVKSIVDSGATPTAYASVILSAGTEFVIRDMKANATESTYTTTTYKQLAQIKEPKKQALLVKTNKPTALTGAAFNNIEYEYRTSTSGLDISLSGDITVNRIGSAIFPYIGTLTDTEETDLIIVPNTDLFTSAFVSGINMTVSGPDSNGNYTVAATGSPNFSNNLYIGDYVYDGTNKGQVVEIINDSQIKVSGTTDLTTSTGVNLSVMFPANIPIKLSDRAAANAVVNGAQTQMVINIGTSLTAAETAAMTVFFNQKFEDAAVISLEARRKRYVKLTSANGFPASLGVPGAFRLRAVYNGTTTSSQEITNEFYLENGQNANYWGPSKLNRVKNFSDGFTSLATTLLVEFDYYVPVGSRGGLKTVDSYSINDELSLADLTNAGTVVNNLEIPAFYDDYANFYDLRECFDFRPFVDQLATDATTAAAASIDPDPNSSIAFTTASNLQFPDPQGDIIFDCTYYEPRQDEISVSIDGDFDINIGGKSLNSDNNPNSIILYRVNVAPYPSLPTNLSVEMQEIMLSRTTGNGDVLTPRAEKYGNTIKKIDAQVKGYTMSDISTLENRITALEYNQNINALDNSVQNLSIQSSVDSTLERFKFGFFVDNFESHRLTDLTDQEHNASIYEFVLQPAKSTTNVKLKVDSTSSPYLSGNKITFPSRRRRLLSQKNATYGPYIPEPQPPAIVEACQFVSNKNTKNIGDSVATYTVLSNVWEEATVRGPDFADSVTRNIEISFYNPTQVAFEVIQTNSDPTANTTESGTVVWSSSTNTPSALPADEAITLYKKLYPVKNASNKVIPFAQNPWFTAQSSGTFSIPGDKTYTAIQGAGKITVPYDYTKGKYITVRSIKKGEVFNYEICYPTITVDDPLFDSGVNEQNVAPPCTKKGTFLYEKCQGTTLLKYVADGNCGSVVGNRTINSAKCGYVANVVVAPVPEAPPAQPQCKPSGTFARQVCSKTADRTLTTYVYTGKRNQTTGECDTRVGSTDTNNVAICKYVAPVPPPPAPVKPAPKPVPKPTDDGCIMPPKKDDDVLAFSPGGTVKRQPIVQPVPPLHPPGKIIPKRTMPLISSDIYSDDTLLAVAADGNITLRDIKNANNGSPIKIGPVGASKGFTRNTVKLR